MHKVLCYYQAWDRSYSELWHDSIMVFVANPDSEAEVRDEFLKAVARRVYRWTSNNVYPKPVGYHLIEWGAERDAYPSKPRLRLCPQPLSAS